MLKLHYIGNGTVIPNVPGRDLSEDEAKRHGGARWLVSTGLYEYIKKPPKAAEEVVPWVMSESQNFKKSS